MSRVDELIRQFCSDGVPYKRVDEIFNISRGKVMSKDYIKDNAGDYPVYSSQTENNGVLGLISTYEYDGEYLTWTTDGANAGTVFYRSGKFSITNVCGLLEVIDTGVLNAKYGYYVLNMTAPDYVNRGMGNPKLMSNVMGRINLPIPPLPVQEEIVRILDNFTNLTAELQAELQARKKQYEYYFSQLLSKTKYPMVKLETIGSVKMCKRILKAQTSSEGEVPFYKIGTFGKNPDAYISKDLFDEYIKKYPYPKNGSVLISCSGTIGRAVVFDGKPSYFQDSNIVWLEHDRTKVTDKYLKYAYRLNPWIVATGGTISRLYNDGILKSEIPLPTMKEQEKIVSILDRFDALCNDFSIGLPAEIAARQKQYEYYRDKLLTFKKAE